MNNLTLKQLRYFQAVARHKHFGRAADACAISQPALSMQIKELEETLGRTLFERSARKVQLTVFGAEMADRAAEILRRVEELGDLALAADKGMIGQLRLGVIPTIAPYLLPRVIAGLAHSHAGLDIHVRETLTARLIEELADGRLDAAIVALPVSEPSLTEVALFEETFVLVRPNKDADRPAPNAQDLQSMRLLLLEEGHCFRDQALAFCNVPSTLPREGLAGSSLSTLVQMVGSGIGVTLIPQMAVRVETLSAPVCVTAFDGPQPKRQIGMIWRKTTPVVEDMMQIADVVRRVGTEVRNTPA